MKEEPKKIVIHTAVSITKELNLYEKLFFSFLHQFKGKAYFFVYNLCFEGKN